MSPISKDELTERQQEILDFIRRNIAEQGYPPTIREIGLAFGIRSTNGVADHLKSLERKGAIVRGELKSRALTPVAAAGAGGPQLSGRFVEVPLVGRVAAGTPILATENVEDTVLVDSFFIGTTKKVFALRVKGESMIGDGIFDGDYIFVKKQLHADAGDIVVAMIEDEATVKRFWPERDRVRLQPSNPKMEPIYIRRDDFRDSMILGVVVGVYRKM